MNDREIAICPWCQTEIVWDEELGPEEQCPHCQNELSDYRSIRLSDTDDDVDEYAVEDDDEAESPDELDETDETDAAHAGGRSGTGGLYTLSSYETATRHLLDRQDVFADCGVCGVEMLHLGKLPPSPLVNQPDTLSAWKRPILDGKLELDAFVCPACFRVEMKLTDSDRIQFVQQLTAQGQEQE
ncbi:hypothetical protein [Paenibacillus sp. HJGM_3]|uniref:hypothetical protein n=1 Tax=Paenibacillus sp. HJGM_3 TaxID=3379816 RepID=UPI00385B2422